MAQSQQGTDVFSPIAQEEVNSTNNHLVGLGADLFPTVLLDETLGLGDTLITDLAVPIPLYYSLTMRFSLRHILSP